MAITTLERTQIEKVFVAFLNAAPSITYLNQLVGYAGKVDVLAKDLSQTDAFKSIYPIALTNEEFAAKFVANFVGSTASADAQTYVKDEIVKSLNAGISRGDTLFNVVVALQAVPDGDATFGTTKKAFENKVAVADYYAITKLGTSTDLTTLQNVIGTVTATTDVSTSAALEAAIAGTVTGQNFTLTAGSDTGAAFTGTASNDTYEAPVVQDGAGNLTDALQNVDQLNGGAGTDTLNATLNAPVGGKVTPTLTSIEVVNVRATGAAEIDLSASTGVTNINVKNSSAVATLTKIGNAAVGVANQNQNVNINGSTATALALSLDTVGTATTDITVDLGSGATNAATSFVITAKDAHVTFAETTASAATTSAFVAATGSNEITFAAADLASLTSLTVTGSGDVDFTGAALTALKTLTAGDGGVKVDATGGVLETVTAGAGKDTVTAVGATVKTINTGAGNDTVNQVTTDLAATATVDLGAGDDAIVFGTKFAAGATVSGGEGTDTIGFAKANYGLVAAYSDANLAKVTGFEVLSITNALATGDTIDVSKIAGITSFKAAAGVTTANSAAVSNLGANTSVELAGAGANNGTLTATLKTNTAADAMTLILNKNFADNNDTTADNTGYTHTVVASEIESLTVNSTAKQTATFTPVDGYKADTVTNTLTLTGSNALTSVTVTGDQKLVLASTAAMTKLASIDGTNNTGGLSFDGSLADMTTPTTSVAMTIKGSATAANTLTGSGHADTITGGAKADTITGGKGGDTLTGNGGNDKFVFVAGDSAIGAGTFDTITDFVANTWGNGTAGAAGTEADLTDATKVTGDVLSFTVGGTAAAANGIKVFVATSAADATTFLANTASADNTQASAALDSTTNKLYVDVTGDGVTDFYINLAGVTTLNAAAFDIN